jgi:hypothetical protein
LVQALPIDPQLLHFGLDVILRIGVNEHLDVMGADLQPPLLLKQEHLVLVVPVVVALPRLSSVLQPFRRYAPDDLCLGVGGLECESPDLAELRVSRVRGGLQCVSDWRLTAS